jgi:sporulation protein YlmC with PRC-barrel domain
MTMAGALAVGTCGLLAQAPQTDRQQQRDYPSATQGQTDRDRTGLTESSRIPSGQSFRAAEASKVIGQDVEDSQGDKLGDIKDLAVDYDNGRIAAVLISHGGILGVGAKLVAVPPSQLSGVMTADDDDYELVLNVNEETLKSAPEFKWDEEDHRQALMTSYRHFGQDYQQLGERQRQQVRETENRLEGTRERTEVEREIRDAADDVSRELGRSSEPIMSHTVSLVKASDLIGSKVEDSAGEDVGKLDNLIVDLESGRIIAAIVGTGGLLGVGQTLHALPPRQLTFDAEEGAFTTRLTKEQFSSAPAFSAENRRNLDNPQWARDVYGHYQEPMFWETDVRSVRDRYDTDRQHERQQRIQEGQQQRPEPR